MLKPAVAGASGFVTGAAEVAGIFVIAVAGLCALYWVIASDSSDNWSEFGLTILVFGSLCLIPLALLIGGISGMAKAISRYPVCVPAAQPEVPPTTQGNPAPSQPKA